MSGIPRERFGGLSRSALGLFLTPACVLRQKSRRMKLGASMQSAVLSRIRGLIRHDASYGFEYALLCAAVAGLLVFAASVFTQETVRLIHELRCNLTPGCAVRLESAARPPASPETAAAQLVVFPLQEPETP